MYAFWGCNPFLNNKVAERKGLHPQNTSLDPPWWQLAHVDIRQFVCIFKIWLFPGVTSPHLLNAISNTVCKYSCLILHSISS
ncbi:hypothetical protein AB205_0216150 [Aquarana catesbeiana]|uniref:Uncharacterized protein n=1 Tax=Aquarana catesbeiana TaxID=8400 RepID=A0A2G9RCU2_AQUCT|nr:hypothetical protein AB205_0216150 [Aquarana catesbeiana]